MVGNIMAEMRVEKTLELLRSIARSESDTSKESVIEEPGTDQTLEAKKAPKVKSKKQTTQKRKSKEGKVDEPA
jgi:hypothetical protein